MAASSAAGDDKAREDLKRRLADRWWRLTHLYWITDKAGNVIRFEPNATQRALLKDLHNRNIVLKSRQHGVTTWACIIALDTALFRSNTNCGLVFHKVEDAQAAFVTKIMFAYERLPQWLKDIRSIVHKDNTGSLELANGSKIKVSLSHRSGTLQFLHISEYGPMWAMSPQRAQEVKSGALNTVSPGGIVTIESTAYGRIGDFYTKCDLARRQQRMREAGEAGLSRMDYQFHFFAWWQDPTNELAPEGVPIGTELAEYFAAKEQELGIELTPRQRAWYAKKAEEQDDKMKREHPTTPDEAFEQAVEGAYYGKAIAKAESDGRICDLPIIPGVPVNTFWDIGRSDMNAIWFHQHIGVWHHFVDYYENSGEQIAHYAEELQRRGYTYGKHYLPHDGGNVDYSGADNKTRKQVLDDLVPGRVVVVERIDMVQDGIDMVRQALPRCRFDKVRCGEDPPGSGHGGVPALLAYRKAWNDKLNTWHDYPLHDWASNGADAFRQFAQGYPLDGINDASARRGRRADRDWRTA